MNELTGDIYVSDYTGHVIKMISPEGIILRIARHTLFSLFSTTLRETQHKSAKNKKPVFTPQFRLIHSNAAMLSVN